MSGWVKLVNAADIAKQNIFEPDTSDPVKRLRRNDSTPTNILYSFKRLITLSLILLGGVHCNVLWMVNHYGIY